MKGKKAIVIGVGISGLCVVKVLSEHFEQVIIIEKDHLASNTEPRSGIPQAHHAHILLVKGKQNFLKIFPDIDNDLILKGAKKFDYLKHGRYLLATGWAPVFDSGLESFACSRNFLEEIMRKRLTRIKNVKFIQGMVTALVSDGKFVCGVKVKSESSSSSYGINCDLVVDASGRNSKSLQWLESLGYKTPKITWVDSDVAYATRFYKKPVTIKDDWKIFAVLNRPPSFPKMGAIFEVENNKWIVTMYSIGKQHPPANENGFLEFAQSLPDPYIYQQIKNAKPISPIHGYRFRGSRFIHFDGLDTWPENFIVLGDAVCTFNPFYGQGMTVASESALLLKDMLSKSATSDELAGFAKNFQKKLTKIISQSWLMATGEDFRWPTTKGKRPNALTRLIQKYIDKVLLASPYSKHAAKAFQEMTQMVKSPIVVFHPSIVKTVIFRQRK